MFYKWSLLELQNNTLGEMKETQPLKTFNSESSFTEVLFTDQNSKSLEIEDKINITSVIN